MVWQSTRESTYIEKYLAEKELDLTATLDAKEAYLNVAALPCSLIPTPPDDEQSPGTFSFTGGF